MTQWIRLGICVFMLCDAGTAQAQAYLSMLHHGSSWGHYAHHFFTEYWHNKVMGDSLISGTSYKVLESGFSSFWNDDPVFLREDTTTKQVWWWHSGQELLIYDYSAGVGDTIEVASNMWLSTDTAQLVLDSVGTSYPLSPWGGPQSQGDLSTPIFYYFHKLAQPNTPPVIWQEGVGSLGGLLFPASGYGIDRRLICAKNNDPFTTLFEDPTWMNTLDSCDQDFVNSIGSLTGFSGLSIIPNPASDAITIQFEGGQRSSGSLFLFDALGKVQIWAEVYPSGNAKLDIRNLSPGLHFIRYVENGSVRWVGKFVKD